MPNKLKFQYKNIYRIWIYVKNVQIFEVHIIIFDK